MSSWRGAGRQQSLIAWDGDPAAASIIVHSAYMTAGQRCTDARRLIIPEGAMARNHRRVNALTDRLRIGAWDEVPEPFMGCLISAAAPCGRGAAALLHKGAKTLRPLARSRAQRRLCLPGLIDVTGVASPTRKSSRRCR